MLSIVITLLTLILILISLFMMLVILMQRPNTNSGMGAAFGGGVAESTFGAETTNIMVKATKYSASAFFVLALLLYLLYIARQSPTGATEEALPEFTTEEAGAETVPAIPEGVLSGDALQITVPEAAAEGTASGSETLSEEASSEDSTMEAASTEESEGDAAAESEESSGDSESEPQQP